VSEYNFDLCVESEEVKNTLHDQLKKVGSVYPAEPVLLQSMLSH